MDTITAGFWHRLTHSDTLFNNWGDTVSSLGPDWGTTCTIWEYVNIHIINRDQVLTVSRNNDCQGRSIGGIVNPGINNLNDALWKFNDITSSYKCS